METFKIQGKQLGIVYDKTGEYHITYVSGTTLFYEPRESDLPMILPLYIIFKLTMKGFKGRILLDKQGKISVRGQSIDELLNNVEKVLRDNRIDIIDRF